MNNKSAKRLTWNNFKLGIALLSLLLAAASNGAAQSKPAAKEPFRRSRWTRCCTARRTTRIYALRAHGRGHRADEESGHQCGAHRESTWGLWEPEDGRFEYAWMDRVVEKLHAAGIRIIMGTPTYSIPAWLYKEHPEIVVTRLGGNTCTTGCGRTPT